VLPRSPRCAVPSALASKRVILGVRPESLYERRAADAASDVARLVVRVEFLEALGSEVLATCRLGAHELVVRLAARTEVKSGETLELLVDLERVCLFDPETGLALA
jgi:multiple sugar transport system ATP-binding protein